MMLFVRYSIWKRVNKKQSRSAILYWTTLKSAKSGFSFHLFYTTETPKC